MGQEILGQIAVGQIVEKYKILEVLSNEAGTEVYLARDIPANRIVRMKFLKPDTEEEKKRFLRELQIVMQIQDDHLIAVRYCGEANGRLFYETEYIDGGVTVKDDITQKGHYDEGRIIKILSQVAKALEHIHQSDKIIHRDIRPDTIMIAPDGKAKIVDMGLAKSSTGTRFTATGAVIGGDIHYISPEAVNGEEMDTRSDIYSLGATAYYMVTGNPPFADIKGELQLLRAVAQNNPISLQGCATISSELLEVITKMMEKIRKNRYQNFSEVLKALHVLQPKTENEDKAEIENKAQSENNAKSGSNAKSENKAQSENKIEFVNSFVPSEQDVAFGWVVVQKKMVDADKMDQYLNRQESLALMGIPVSLDYTLVEQKAFSLQDWAKIHSYILQNWLANKVAKASPTIVKAMSKILSPNQQQKLSQSQNIGLDELVTIISDTRRRDISSYVFMYNETTIILTTSVSCGLLSKSDSEKCADICKNSLTAKKYQDIESILVGNKFLSPEAFKAVLRGIRREAITGKSAVEYVREKQVG